MKPKPWKITFHTYKQYNNLALSNFSGIPKPSDQVLRDLPKVNKIGTNLILEKLYSKKWVLNVRPVSMGLHL